MKKNSFCTCSFAVLITIMILSNSFYALSAPFLPPVFELKKIHPGYVGAVFAAFSIATVIFSPLISNWMKKDSQPLIIFGGLLLMGISVFSFGFVEQVSSPATVISIAILLRFIQGKLVLSFLPSNQLTCIIA